MPSAGIQVVAQDFEQRPLEHGYFFIRHNQLRKIAHEITVLDGGQLFQTGQANIHQGQVKLTRQSSDLFMDAHEFLHAILGQVCPENGKLPLCQSLVLHVNKQGVHQATGPERAVSLLHYRYRDPAQGLTGH